MFVDHSIRISSKQGVFGSSEQMYIDWSWSLTNRNGNYAFSSELPPNQANRTASAPPPNSNVSFPVISSFQSVTNGLIVPPDISHMSQVSGVEAPIPLYNATVTPSASHNDYMLRRTAQRASKRQRRYVCHYLSCQRAFDSQWALQR